jgi:homeobox protein cut-like
MKGESDAHADGASVARWWQEFDLEGMRPKLDEEGLKVAAYQEDAMANRKKLAEATKEFRKKLADDPNSKVVGALLRQYQEEIDRLTKRAKHGEGAFLALYQKLFEAPDPAPTLAHAFETTSRATELEAQLRKLGQELAEYKAESTLLKNQASPMQGLHAT